MLQPKKVKHRKWHKGRSRNRNVETRGLELNFGNIGLKSLSNSWVSAAQIDSAKKSIQRHLEKSGRLWIRIFPDKPVTKKPPEVTMGSGKGAVDHYVFHVRPGRIIFEIDGVRLNIARDALRTAASKLPLRTKVVIKEN